MKITTFNPLIVTASDDAVKLFEEVDLKTAKALLMVSPSDFAIEVIEHIKE